MIGGVHAAQTEQTPALTDFNQLPQQTSQAAQDILIPYFAGINRIKTIWVTPALNITSQQVKTTGGGGKGGQGNANSGQYKYFADFIAVIAMGPADRLANVIIDNTVAFSGSILASGEYTQVDLGQWGIMRISWGTETQNPPSMFGHTDSTSGNQFIFSGQRGKVRIELNQLYFGAVGRTSAPTIELVIERWPDVPGYAHGHNHIARLGSGVSPIAVIYEIMTNVRYGLGLSPALFDMTYITNSIETLFNTAIWISPLIDSQQPFRSVIQDLCQYFDGFVRKVNGLFQIGYYTHAATIGSGAPSLDFSSFLPPGVKFKPVGYSGTINEVMMTSMNSINFFTPNTLRAADSASRLITGQARNVQIDRPYLVDPGVAKGYVEEFLRFNSNPLVTGSGDVKKEAMYTINVGDLAQIQAGDFGAQVLCRITSKTWDTDISGKCTIEFEQERGTYTSAYSPPKEYPDLNVYVNPAEISFARLIQLPTDLRTNQQQLQIAILAERASNLDVGFLTWISDDGIIYEPTGILSAFAVHSSIISDATISVSQGQLDPVGFTVYSASIDNVFIASIGEQLAQNNAALMFVDREIMSLETVTALGNDMYQIFAIRGLYGTAVATHTYGTDVWLQSRVNIQPISWIPFEPGRTFYFKLQSVTRYSVFDLSSSSVFAFTVSSINSSLAGPTNFAVGSNSEDREVVFNWTLDPSPGVFGYEIRYAVQGTPWEQATNVIDGLSSSHSLATIIPPGDWVFYLTDYDQLFNFSPNIQTALFTVHRLFDLVEINYGVPQHDLDPGANVDAAYGDGGSAFSNCFVHPTCWVLVPIDQTLASFVPVGGDGFETFDNFAVTFPAQCVFTSVSIDSLGSDTNMRSSIVVYEYLFGFEGAASSGLDFQFSFGNNWQPTTITNGVRHSSDTVVVPQSSRLASYVPTGGNGFETFDNFVLDPLTPTTVGYDQDVGQLSPIRASLGTRFANGPTSTLSPLSSAFIARSVDNVNFTNVVSGTGFISADFISEFVLYQASLDNTSNVGMIRQMTVDALSAPADFWITINGQVRTSKDNITFSNWSTLTSSFSSDRYVQFQVAWSPSFGHIWPGGVASIWILLDAPSSVQRNAFSVVAIGGTTFTFDPPYRTQIPTINVTIVGSTALTAIIVSQDLLTFRVRIFNVAGSDVGGIINWFAEGV